MSNQLPKWILNKGHSLSNCSSKFSVIIKIFSLFQLKYLYSLSLGPDLQRQSQRKCRIIVEQKKQIKDPFIFSESSEVIYVIFITISLILTTKCLDLYIYVLSNAVKTSVYDLLCCEDVGLCSIYTFPLKIIMKKKNRRK